MMAFQRHILEKAKKIKLAVFDVDGVLTDGRLILGGDGSEYKAFHVRDGHGLVMLREHGCQIGIITARSSSIVAERMAALGIKHVYQGERQKDKVITRLMEELNICKEEACYVGDDVIDLPAMQQVGLAVAVADAHDTIRQYADWISGHKGGNGAVREICDLILYAQKN